MKISGKSVLWNTQKTTKILQKQQQRIKSSQRSVCHRKKDQPETGGLEYRERKDQACLDFILWIWKSNMLFLAECNAMQSSDLSIEFKKITFQRHGCASCL